MLCKAAERDIDLGEQKMSFVHDLCGNDGLVFTGPLHHRDGTPTGGVYHSMTGKWDPSFVSRDKLAIQTKDNFNLDGLGGVVVFYNSGRVAIKSNEEFIKTDMAGGMKNVSRAFQNGPRLIIGGSIPKDFSKYTHRAPRIGLGYDKPGAKLKVIYSMEPVSLAEFANMGREAGLKEMMYLDGGEGIVGISFDGKCQGNAPRNALKLKFR